MSTAFMPRPVLRSWPDSTSLNSPFMPRWSAAVIILADVMSLAALYAVLLRVGLLLMRSTDVSAPVRFGPVLFVVLLFHWLFDLHPAVSVSPVDELKRLTLANTSAFICLSVFVVTERASTRVVALYGAAWVLSCLLTPCVRAGTRNVASRFQWWGYPVIVFGAGDALDNMIDRLQRNPRIGLRPVLAVAEFPREEYIEGVPVCSPSEIRKDVITGVRHAVVVASGISPQLLTRLLDRGASDFPNVIVVSDTDFICSLGTQTFDMRGLLGLRLRNSMLHLGPRVAKRATDIFLCTLLLPLLSPLVAIISILIAIESGWPVFYSQDRLGRHGRPFHIWKFRTMVKDAQAVLEKHLQQRPELREEWDLNHKLRKDPRITRVGAILRKTSLDELPQLWNVLKGDMSIVGPRPIVCEEVAKYKDAYPLYAKTTPGLTGLWQVSGRNDTTYEQRVAYDAYYVRNWCIWMDLYLLLKTVAVVLTGDGAY
jgi:Undecaprenyl-phosphate galactose phosphotransferase WbaP